jgi:hypothetical protein
VLTNVVLSGRSRRPTIEDYVLVRSLDHIAPAGLLAACLGLFGYAASHRPFWFDETLTAYIAAQPTLSDMWGAIRAGFDLTPPLFHLISRAAAALGGRPELMLRLPGLVGFGVMGACLFVFARRRCGLAASIAAMLLPIGALPGRYAVEARPYGMALGTIGVALVCWQVAVEGRRRRAALIGLASAIAVGVSLHYYTILVLLPIVAGEAVRFARDRRPDWGVWRAATAGVLALPINLWILGISRGSLQNAWAPAPEWHELGKFYWETIGPVAPLAIVAGAVLWLRRRPQVRRAHEIAAAIALAAAGLFVFAAGIGITGVFVSRYALPSGVGLAILLAFAVDMDARLARGAAAALCVIAGANVYGALATPVEAAAPPLLKGRTNVVCSAPLRFLPLSYYGSPDARYLADPAHARRWIGTDTVERELLALRSWAPVRVEEYSATASARAPFLLYWRPGLNSWLMRQLREDGAELRLLDEQVNTEGLAERLYAVDWPKPIDRGSNMGLAPADGAARRAERVLDVPVAGH